MFQGNFLTVTCYLLSYENLVLECIYWLAYLLRTRDKTRQDNEWSRTQARSML